MSRDKTKELKPQEGEHWLWVNKNGSSTKSQAFTFESDTFVNLSPIERLYTEAEAKELLGNSEEFKNGEMLYYSDGSECRFIGYHQGAAVVAQIDDCIYDIVEEMNPKILSREKPPSPEEIKEKEVKEIRATILDSDCFVDFDEDLHALGVRAINGELKRVD